MPFLQKLSAKRQVWLKNILETQCADVYCPELIEAFAERVYEVERDPFCQSVLQEDGSVIIELLFGDTYVHLVLVPVFISGEKHALN